MLLLGIETSCDETAVALVQDGTQVLTSVIVSSQGSFAKLAGVIPEEAARKQVECMIPVLQEALMQSNLSMDQIDAIAVTRGPGLMGSLLVGTTAARTLASIFKKPLVGVHHTLGHLTSPWLRSAENASATTPLFPCLTLSASGGHTDLWYRESHTKGTLIGRTRDDAAGEAFDKGASILGLGYPGGPAVSLAGKDGKPDAFPFPLPLHDEDNFDFSFSGLKTSLKYLVRNLGDDAQNKLADICASFEQAICAHLMDRLEKALDRYPEVQGIHLVGGVSANTRLRSSVQHLCKRNGPIAFHIPLSFSYCTDNAAMIAAAGYFLAQEEGNEAYDSFITLATLPLQEITG